MSEQPFRLLQLPSDLLAYLVREHLATVPAVSLSLTCRDLFELVFTHLQACGRLPLSAPDVKAEFCELLERDVSQKYYFCPVCPALHPYSPSDGPACSDFAFKLPRHDCRRRRWMLEGSGFTLGMHHVRLALNRALYGPPSGIPLERFELKNLTDTYPCFVESWSARVIDGDLFLSSTRRARWEAGYRALLDALYLQRYRLCEHVLLHEVPTLRPRGNAGGEGEPCRDVLGHCRQCFTDWTVTVERPPPSPAFAAEAREGAAPPLWLVTLCTYHRFLSGRPQPPLRLEADGRFLYEVEVIPLYREPGLVRDIWFGCASETAKAGRWVHGGMFQNPNR